MARPNELYLPSPAEVEMRERIAQRYERSADRFNKIGWGANATMRRLFAAKTRAGHTSPYVTRVLELAGIIAPAAKRGAVPAGEGA